MSPKAGGTKLPDPLSARINVENQREKSDSEKRFELYLEAVREFYELLNAEAVILDSFKTNNKLLKHFNLTKLLTSEDVDHKDLGIKFSLLLYRFDTETTLVDITRAPVALEALQKHNVRETW